MKKEIRGIGVCPPLDNGMEKARITDQWRANGHQRRRKALYVSPNRHDQSNRVASSISSSAASPSRSSIASP